MRGGTRWGRGGRGDGINNQTKIGQITTTKFSLVQRFGVMFHISDRGQLITIQAILFELKEIRRGQSAQLTNDFWYFAVGAVACGAARAIV